MFCELIELEKITDYHFYPNTYLYIGIIKYIYKIYNIKLRLIATDIGEHVQL